MTNKPTPPAAASPEPGAVEVLNELAAAAQEYGNSGSTNSMRRLFAARERADDLLVLRTAAPRADATAGGVTVTETQKSALRHALTVAVAKAQFSGSPFGVHDIVDVVATALRAAQPDGGTHGA